MGEKIYSLLLQDFSKYLMLISKNPESCWLAMSAASLSRYLVGEIDVTVTSL